uniref:F-box domain-containing protein n=1 Tax=Plectus sambesii TaxID=2011161 RepID=A0A914VAV6_9BILA
MTMEEKAESSLKRKALQKPLADDEDGVVRKRANIERTFLTDDILIHVLQFVKKNPTNGLKNILQLQAANKRMRNMVELLYFSKLTVRQHEKDGLRMNGVALKVDDLQTRLNFFLDCFIRVSILEIRFMPDDVAEGNWWTKLGDCLRDSGKMELKSLTVRTTWNDDQFFGTSDLRFWITNMIESNKPTLRRLDVPASLIPLDSDWHLSYLRLRFLYHPPSQYIYRNEAYHFLPKQSLPIANFISRLKEVKRLCVDGCLGFSAAGDPLEVVCDSLKIVPFYLSASVLKVRRLEVMWPDPSMLFAAPAIVYHFLTLEHFLRQVQTQTPRGAPPTYLSSVRVLGGRFTL